ncbi:MAG: twin-arginine translocase TatA/TatE family subunit [bacterium]|nr:twin-arginine translocase TatA/TatE family subunit [bacterium]
MVAFIGGMGGQEILMILAVALVIFGPKRIPAIAKSLSKITLQVRQASRQFQREIYSNLDPEEIVRKATREGEPMGSGEVDDLYRRQENRDQDATEPADSPREGEQTK